MTVSVMLGINNPDGTWDNEWLELFRSDSITMARDFVDAKINVLTSRGGYVPTESTWVLDYKMSNYRSVKFWLKVDLAEA